MVIHIIIYAVAIAAVIALTFVIPESALELQIAAIAVSLLGGVSLILRVRRPGDQGFRDTVRKFLQQSEQVHNDYLQRKPLERQVGQLARFLVEDLRLSAVAVYARRKQTYRLIEVLGINRDQVSRHTYIGHREVEQALETQQGLVPLQSILGSANVRIDGYPFDVALPVMSGRRCHYFIVIATDGTANLPQARPFLLALADQIGNYKFLEDAQYRSGSGRSYRQPPEGGRQEETLSQRNRGQGGERSSQAQGRGGRRQRPFRRRNGGERRQDEQRTESNEAASDQRKE